METQNQLLFSQRPVYLSSGSVGFHKQEKTKTQYLRLPKQRHINHEFWCFSMYTKTWNKKRRSCRRSMNERVIHSYFLIGNYKQTIAVDDPIKLSFFGKMQKVLTTSDKQTTSITTSYFVLLHFVCCLLVARERNKTKLLEKKMPVISSV